MAFALSQRCIWIYHNNTFSLNTTMALALPQQCLWSHHKHNNGFKYYYNNVFGLTFYEKFKFIPGLKLISTHFSG